MLVIYKKYCKTQIYDLVEQIKLFRKDLVYLLFKYLYIDYIVRIFFIRIFLVVLKYIGGTLKKQV